MQPFYQPRGEDLQISVLTREFTFPTHLHAHVELAHAFSGPLAMWIDGQTWALEPGDTAIAFAHWKSRARARAQRPRCGPTFR